MGSNRTSTACRGERGSRGRKLLHGTVVSTPATRAEEGSGGPPS